MANSDDYKRTVKGRANTLMSNARARCKSKSVEIYITQQWVEEHLTRGTCELTGIPFSFEPPPEGLTRRPDAPSLDRINKHKHYTEDNTRVILWAVNCALAEYGTEIMLPILKATVKGIEDAQQKSATPVSTGHSGKSEVNPKHGALLTPRTWEDSDDAHHHCGADARKDLDSRSQASSRNSMACRGNEVGTSQTPQSQQDNWYLNPAYGWLEY